MIHRLTCYLLLDVKVVLNGQTFEPFNSAFNAVNMSYVQIKGSIRQARCAGFKNKLEPIENSLPFRKKEVIFLNFNQVLKLKTSIRSIQSVFIILVLPDLNERSSHKLSPKLLNFKWKNTMDPEFQAFQHAQFSDHNEADRLFFYLIGAGFLLLCLLPLAVCLVLRAIQTRKEKLLRDAPRFQRVTRKNRKSKLFLVITYKLII